MGNILHIHCEGCVRDVSSNICGALAITSVRVSPVMMQDLGELFLNHLSHVSRSVTNWEIRSVEDLAS